jgi:hypothetical protein
VDLILRVCTASGSRILTCSPRGLTALVGAEPAVIIAGWLIRPARVSQAPGHRSSLTVAHGAHAPSALPTLCWSPAVLRQGGSARILASDARPGPGASPGLAGGCLDGLETFKERLRWDTVGLFAPGRWHRCRVRWAAGRAVPGGDPLVQGGEHAHAQLRFSVGCPAGIPLLIALRKAGARRSRRRSARSAASRCASCSAGPRR